MFSLNLRRVYCVCDKIMVRTLRNRRFEVAGPNPGLDKRVAAFREEGIPFSDDAEELIETSESEFHNVSGAYNEHIKESFAGRQDLRHKIITEKYFKMNLPNLLTWSEKEQIRHLATSQPDEWTPERIAESFPVTVAIVKKLLKYPWKPATQDRIARHDASAMRNWRELKEDSLDIPQELREHLLKFSERTIPPLNKESVKPSAMEEKMGEFEKIIRRCAENKDKETDVEANDSTDVALYSPSNMNNHNKDRKRVTLEEMAAKIKNRLESGKGIDLPDQILLSAVHSNNLEISSKKLSKEIDLHDAEQTNAVAEYKDTDEKQTSIMEYPDRIRIPKKAYKKGATYKVNDCYYDHDGKFLYRVLGMSS